MSGEYTFRVRGRLSPDVVAALHPLHPAESTTETVLRGTVADQAALLALIARLEQLGVELVGLLQLPDAGPAHRSGRRAGPRSPRS